MMRVIEGPLAIVLVGNLEITQGGFDKDVRDGDVESGLVAAQMAEAVLEENEEEESSAGEDIEEFIHLVGGGGPLPLQIGSFMS